LILQQGALHLNNCKL